MASSDLRPFFDHVEIITTGDPRIVSSPVGTGIRFAAEDRVSYKFPVSEPWLCPFYINQCPAGITLSFWFQCDSVVSNYYKYYITLGNTLLLYKQRTNPSKVHLRWNVDNQFSWYSNVDIHPDQWHLITWIVNHTHNVVYKDGVKYRTRLKGPFDWSPERKGNTLHMNEYLNNGNFSVGPMQFWSGRKSPVFMWRLFQEGLRGYDDIWSFLRRVYRNMTSSTTHLYAIYP